MGKAILRLGKACVKQRGEFKCRSIPYGLNRVLAMHWAVRAAWKKAWEEQVAIAVLENRESLTEAKGSGERARPLVQVTYRGFTLQDIDNATGGIKPLLDGLVKSGVIPNDDQTSIELKPVIYELASKGENESTSILLEW